MTKRDDDQRQRERIAVLKELPQEDRIRCLQEEVGLGLIDGATFTKLLAETGQPDGRRRVDSRTKRP